MYSAKNSKQSIAVLIILIVGFGAGYMYAKNDYDVPQPASPPGADSAEPVSITTSDFKGIERVWEIIQRDYYDEKELNKKTLLEGAMHGFVESIGDPYTVYMTPDETKEFHQSLNGRLEGIGALLESRNNALTIVTPLKDSPAEKAGLKVGDIIIKIEGADASTMSLYEAVSKIRGPDGTTVLLTIAREGRAEPFDVIITRGKIEVESVTYEKKEDGIFLVSVNQFSDTTQDEFGQAINKILLEDPKGLILDLRFNGGGFLDIAIDMLSEFLPENTPVVRIKKRNPTNNEVMHTAGNPRLLDMPLVVLVNEGSASASEIVAGAIQDHKRGIIIGTQTFGKGSVQELTALKDGGSIRITIAKWFTPNDRSIDEVGVTPDKIVEVTEQDQTLARDPQMEEAVRYLKGV